MSNYIINGMSASIRLAIELKEPNGRFYGWRYCDVSDVDKVLSEIHKKTGFLIGEITLANNYSTPYERG